MRHKRFSLIKQTNLFLFIASWNVCFKILFNQTYLHILHINFHNKIFLEIFNFVICAYTQRMHGHMNATDYTFLTLFVKLKHTRPLF